MEPSRQLSAGAVPIFREGILLTLSKWWALQMAVVQEWGGRNSALIAEQLGQDVLSWFTQSKEPLYIDDLEQILENGLMSLNTMEEDGSTEEVAEKLMILHEECLDGNFTSIQKLREASAMEAGHSRISKVVDDEDEDCSDTDESMEMAVDAPENRPCRAPEIVMVKEPKPAQAVDPDGWTVVGSKKNKGRKK
ncbi:hypothetical protein MLD38_012861 [Melastoma candidum]|uniref:Uncharacterized protein n=1 Tax=Melastoma candidum TaxID=119954 RepID=A0ACB9R7X3_9MYRT|nr:hypothetical protein MLD38_012861 [Melastoma candidum]